MHSQSWMNLAHPRRLLLWALMLPAAFADKTTTESAGVSRPGPDQRIVDLVPVEVAPHVGRTNIHHHHEHVLDHLEAEADDKQPLGRRSASSFIFPTAFDTSLSNNFTSSTCPQFFNKFLSDPSFANCHAISTLLRDSTGFFHTLSSAASTSHVLDIACAADVTSCTSTMFRFATDLRDDGNCGQDYDAGNPLVANAYLGMITYEPLYRATCLQNPDTSDYCFVDAVTNTSNPASYDIYFLPYGSTIQSSSTPACTSCLQATLDIFSKSAQVAGQPLAESYIPSALAVNSHCGAGFSNVNITVSRWDEDVVPSAASTLKTLSLPLWVSSTIGIALLVCI